MLRRASRAVTKRVTPPSSLPRVWTGLSASVCTVAARPTFSQEPVTFAAAHSRAFSSTPAVMSGTQRPQIVGKTDADETAARTALETLLDSGRWAVTANGLGIERSFKFKNFTKTWDFMTAVALQCKLKNHHPEWSNVYNTTFIRWTTHNPGAGLAPGLTVKDTELALLCDELGRAFGEVAEEAKPKEDATPAEHTSADNAACTLSSLANNAAGAAGGDCCAPRPKKD